MSIKLSKREVFILRKKTWVLITANKNIVMAFLRFTFILFSNVTSPHDSVLQIKLLVHRYKTASRCKFVKLTFSFINRFTFYRMFKVGFTWNYWVHTGLMNVVGVH